MGVRAGCVLTAFEDSSFNGDQVFYIALKGWLAIAKLKPLSLFISLSIMLKKAFDNVKVEK